MGLNSSKDTLKHLEVYDCPPGRDWHLVRLSPHLLSLAVRAPLNESLYPVLAQLVEVETLSTAGMHDVATLQVVEPLKNLGRLSVSRVGALEDLSGHHSTRFHHVDSLTLGYCVQLASVSGLSQAPNLKTLHLVGCAVLTVHCR